MLRKPTLLCAALVLAAATTGSAQDAKAKPKIKAKPGVATKQSVKASTALLGVEQSIIAKTNAERTRRGLQPLVVDASLMRSARRHTTWMTNTRSLQHTTKPVAENIAMGQRSSSEAVRSWMNSPGHRANILNGGYRRIGVAAYRTPSGVVFWCQQFLR